jgi:hypothetical protein
MYNFYVNFINKTGYININEVNIYSIEFNNILNNNIRT